MAAVKPELLVEVPVNVELTIVVFAPAVGAAPLLLPKEGVLGEVARNNTYPVVVAPDTGKVAALQLKLMLLDEDAVAVRPDACAVGGLESVRKVISFP